MGRRGSVAAVVLVLALVACGKFLAEAEDDTPSDGGPPPFASDAAGTEDRATGTSDAGTPTWTWEANDLEDWKISNVDGAETTDCCGPCPGNYCTPTAVTGCNNTTAVATGASVVFKSGPAFGSTSHRYDGFYATRQAVPVVPGRRYRAKIGIIAMRATVFPAAWGPEAFQRPEWSFGAREGTTFLSKYQGNFSTWQCAKCEATASEIGERAIEFTPLGNKIDLVIRAQHKSSQCNAEASDVEVEVDYVRLEEL